MREREREIGFNYEVFGGHVCVASLLMVLISNVVYSMPRNSVSLSTVDKKFCGTHQL